MDPDKRCAIEGALKKLRNMLIPQCVNIGDQLAYSACKERIIDDISFNLGFAEETGQKPEILSVDPQKIAHDVIERTFDSHARLLREKLRVSEIDREKWKKIALSNVPDAFFLFEEMKWENAESRTKEAASQCNFIPTSDKSPNKNSNNLGNAFVIESSVWYEKISLALLSLMSSKFNFLLDCFVLLSPTIPQPPLKKVKKKQCFPPILPATPKVAKPTKIISSEKPPHASDSKAPLYVIRSSPLHVKKSCELHT